MMSHKITIRPVTAGTAKALCKCGTGASFANGRTALQWAAEHKQGGR